MTEPSKDDLEHQLFHELTKDPETPTVVELWDTMVRLAKLLSADIERQIPLEHDPEKAADLHALSEMLGRLTCN